METRSYQALDNQFYSSDKSWKERLTTFSPLCCGFWCCIVTTVLVVIFVPLLFLVWIPNMIQDNVDYASFQFVSVSLSNATNESVFMEATIEMFNTGGYDAVIDSFTAKAYLTDGSFVGTLKLPKTKIKANEGATVSLEAPLVVKNLTNFQHFAGAILKGIDMELELKGDTSIDVTLSSGSNVVTDISVSNSIIMKGVLIQNAVSDNMIVLAATSEDTISATLDMSWSALTLSQLSLSFDNIKNNIYDTSGEQLGYATIEKFNVVPGYNDLTSVPVTIERTSTNADSISKFFGNYLMGQDQTLIVVGPIPSVTTKTTTDGNTTVTNTIVKSTVVDYGLTLYVTAKGSTDGDTIIGGIITKETQQGWTVEVDGEDLSINGAYSSIQNTLDVNISVIKSSANLYFQNPLEYSYNISIPVTSDYSLTVADHCDATNSYAHIYTGYGMYKDMPKVTNVNVSANSATSFFSIAEPMTGQYGYNTPSEVDCLTLEYPCCFIFITTAAICRDNPTLMQNTSNELQQSFISLSVESNMTVLVDSLFEVEFSYSQDSFPLSFGQEIYQGYTESYGFSCQNVKVH